MGIAYLWDLLLACGKRVPLDFLRGKILAIDASIWITRADAVFGNTTLTIRSILSKIIALMKLGIKPIFVFDGTPPSIKRNCLELRRRRRLEFGEKQIKKLAQIEILKMIKGGEEKPKRKKLEFYADSQKDKEREKEIERDKDQEEDDVIQISLDQVPTQIDNIKSELYTQLLLEKYRLIKKMYPHFFLKYTEEEFLKLPADSMAYFIEDTQNNVYDQYKPRKIKDQSCEKALERRLKIIKNKTRINQLRDEIYRRVIEKIDRQVNEQKNLQTIVGTYQGNTFKQTRRIEKKPVNNIGNIIKRNNEIKIQNSQVIEQTQIEEKQVQREMPVLKEGESFLDFLKAGFGGKDSDSEKDEFEMFENMESKDAKESGEVNMMFDKFVISQSPLKFENNKTQQSPKNQPGIKLIDIRSEDEEYPAFNQVYEYQMTMTGQKANIQLRQLLDLLGLPYVCAPSQAQAQCAELQKQGLVEGIITDDSDVFAFGGKNVYRGVFENDVRYYGQIEWKKELKFQQEQFIIFALFTGSDYTEGVKGVGLVNAMEIIRPFNTFDKLVHFREWAKLPDALNPENAQFYNTTNEQQKKFFEFHKNFKNYWYVDETFPNNDVIEAYISPKVQTKIQKFEFREPNVKILQMLLRQKMKLTQDESDRKIKELNEAVKEMKTTQTRIQDYFLMNKESIGRIRSKRLENALK